MPPDQAPLPIASSGRIALLIEASPGSLTAFEAAIAPLGIRTIRSSTIAEWLAVRDDPRIVVKIVDGAMARAGYLRAARSIDAPPVLVVDTELDGLPIDEGAGIDLIDPNAKPELVRARVGLCLRLRDAQIEAARSGDAELHERLRRSDVLLKSAAVLSADLDLDKLVQRLTDEATAICRAEFGAFFHNVVSESGESYMLYSLSGVPREAFSSFPMPRNTAVFGPTFRGEGIVRSDDITADPRYGQNPPYRGIPEGHLPVRSYLAVPVRARDGSALGGLFFGHSAPAVFTADDEGLVRAISTQAAVAIENATLYRAARRAELAETRRAREAALGVAIGAALAHKQSLPATLQASAEAIVEHLDAALARVWTLDPAGDALILRASAGLYTDVGGAHARVPLDRFPIGVIAAQRRPHSTNGLQQDPRIGEWAKREGIVAFAGYPLVVGERLMGVLAMFASEPLHEGTLHELASVADSVALGIERWHADEELRRLLAREKRVAETQGFLAEASAQLASSIEYEATLSTIAKLAVPKIADWCTVHLVDNEGDPRQLAVEHVDPTKVELALELQQRYPPDPDAPTGVHEALRTQKSQTIPEITDDLLAALVTDPEQLAMIRALGLRSSMLVPMVAHDRSVGAIAFVSAESGRVYGSGDLAFAEELARRAATAIENARLYEEVRELNTTLERRVVERTSELLEANKELEAFSYTVSHDLRAPIRHIGGFIDLLEKSAAEKLDEKSLRYVRTVRGAARQMGALIDALLAFSRVGRADITIAPVDLGAVFRDVIASSTHDSARIDIDVGTLPVVHGDAVMLRAVASNLIENAIKYSESRAKARIEVGTLAGERDGEAIVYVKDNGVGFDMAYAHKLFGVFQRLHTDAEFEGTGIGLATVRRIVVRHGGRVWAEAKPDEGATFYFALPVGERS